MTFRYRFVGFGTNFEFRHGIRHLEDASSNPSVLHENEIALDVGNVCWGCDGEPLCVIDHHFERPGQFPSASAAVLHNARLLEEKFRGCGDGPVWLVTHVQPDFDAFCSMYLTRCIVERKIAADFDLDETDWFHPELFRAFAPPRWAVLLASYASHVDSGRHIACPKQRALHSVLYAALHRGRAYVSVASGATEFFDEVREAIESKDLNPLFDSVLEGRELFRPELAMLDNEVEAYERDLRRARKSVVHLQRLDLPFQDFFTSIRNTPLLREDLSLAPGHLLSPSEPRSQADGIYLNDPECILFKEWARSDLQNSSMGSGFTFTAVAYSGGRPEGTTNRTDYFFAIDPERAERRNLYSLWARLEAAEVQALHKPEHTALKEKLEEAELHAQDTSKNTFCRLGFEGRAGAYRAFFNDPWFDGSNYEATIVATPNRGTFIGRSGDRSDLLDDPVGAIVRRELEHSIYASEDPQINVVDLAASREHKDEESRDYPIGEGSLPEPLERHFRFGKIKLNSGVDILGGRMSAQIGETLWRALHPDAGEGTPTDFLTRHLLVNRDWVGVWSRRGIVIAFKPAAEEKARAIERRFRELASLARSVEVFIESRVGPIHETVAEGEELTRAAARVSHELALPENRLLGRFFDALGLRELLGALRDLNLAAADKASREQAEQQTKELTRHTRTVADVQVKVEWLEIFIVGFYATELAKIIVDGLGRETGQVWIPLTAGIVSMAAAMLALRPWKH